MHVLIEKVEKLEPSNMKGSFMGYNETSIRGYIRWMGDTSYGFEDKFP